MKPTSLDGVGSHAIAIQRGWVRPAGTESEIEYPSLDLNNDSGEDILEGEVVVVTADGSIAKTTNVSDERPTGVALDDIDDGDSGPVQFIGPVDFVVVGSSVTAGNWLRTSSVSGEAEEVSSPSGAFAYITASGTEPEAFLIPGGGGGGSGSLPGGEVPVDHGNMGSTETIDVSLGTWHRGTLDADCTITVTGFTVDEGLVAIFEITQDSTGGWGITWDPDVQFIGTDDPDTDALTESVFLLFSSAGNAAVFGAKVGGAGGTSSSDTEGWIPVLDGTGHVVADGSGQAVMAFGPF